MSGIKAHFNTKKRVAGVRGGPGPSKRVAEEREEGEIDSDADAMEEDVEVMGESSSGGATEAGQGLSHMSVIPQKHFPIFSFDVKRNLRFSFINSVEGYVINPAGDIAQWGTDFFEIPHNHMGFYLPPHIAQLVGFTTAYKINSANWHIANLQFIAAQENIPPAQNPPTTFEMQGNANFTIDTLQNPSVQPNNRMRIWAYDGYGRQRADADNGAGRINTTCNLAEYQTMALPLIQFNTKAPTSTTVPVTPAMYRWCRNHKLDSKIGATCNVIKGWRRNSPGTDQLPAANWPGTQGIPWTQETTEGLNVLNFANLPVNYANTNNVNIVGSDIIGSDCKVRRYTYRTGHGNEIYAHNPDFFIRIRDPPRWGNGANAGSNNTSPANQLAVKCVIDIETSINITCTMDQTSGEQIAATGLGWNDIRWMDKTWDNYNIPDLSGATIVVNPGGLPPAYSNTLPPAPNQTPL